MEYKNGEMKIDELVGYFCSEKINLIPPFQRNRVWRLHLRQKLLENMVKGKPIPAIFLYKQAAGSTYSYNILDGKQRLESLLLFIGNDRPDLSIPKWREYFFQPGDEAGFAINLANRGQRSKKVKFAELDEDLVREFREYRIPVIEIDLDDEDGSLDDVISLFIDINQYGVKVSRFDIVRTMNQQNKLLADVFKLIAVKQKRKKDIIYKMNDSDFSKVLKRLQIVQNLTEKQRQQKVDRMWERLLEIVLFVRTRQHRTLAQILKAFIGAKVDSSPITGSERAQLKLLFTFLRSVYAQAGFRSSKLAVDQTHFYTMITSIYALDLIDKYGDLDLKQRLGKLAKIIDGNGGPSRGKTQAFKAYIELSSKQTTHPGRRAKRQELFVELLKEPIKQ